MNEQIEILPVYKHTSENSVFVIFDAEYKLHWCFSGNVLRDMYLRNPEKWISGPIELALPKNVNEALAQSYEDF